MEKIISAIREAFQSSTHYEEREYNGGVIHIGLFKECYVFEYNGEIFFNNTNVLDKEAVAIPVSMIGDLDIVLASGATSMNIHNGGNEYAVHIQQLPKYRILKQTTGRVMKQSLMPIGCVKALKEILKRIK